MLIRFGVRMAILIAFATFGSIGFGRSLVALLWMATILSAVVAAMRREPPFDTVLNHWDEMMTYAALCMLVIGLIRTVPLAPPESYAVSYGSSFPTRSISYPAEKHIDGAHYFGSLREGIPT